MNGGRIHSPLCHYRVRLRLHGVIKAVSNRRPLAERRESRPLVRVTLLDSGRSLPSTTIGGGNDNGEHYNHQFFNLLLACYSKVGFNFELHVLNLCSTKADIFSITCVMNIWSWFSIKMKAVFVFWAYVVMSRVN